MLHFTTPFVVGVPWGDGVRMVEIVCILMLQGSQYVMYDYEGYCLYCLVSQVVLFL